jgi:hypothetical protein
VTSRSKRWWIWWAAEPASGRFFPIATTEEIVKLPWLVPSYAEPNGDLKLTVHSWLVQTPRLNILVDTGVGNGKLNRSRPHWNDRN